MNKFYFLLALLFSALIFPQNNWKKLNGLNNSWITMVYADENNLYVGAGVNGVLYKSDLDGKNRIEVARFGTLILDFISLPDESYLVCAEFSGVYKSYNLKDWIKVFNYDYSQCFGKGMNNTIYLGNFWDLLSSDFYGISWKNDLHIKTRVSDILTIDSTVFVGCRESFFYRKQGTNGNWELTKFNVLGNIKLTADNNKNVYMSDDQDIRFSSDMGESWLLKNQKDFLGAAWFTNIHYDKYLFSSIAHNNYIYPDTFSNAWGVAVSKDEGSTWELKSNGLPYGDLFTQITSSGSDIFVASENNGLYQTKNFGENWYPINENINSSDIRTSVLNSKGDVFVIDYSNGFQRSTDGGTSWKTFGNDLNLKITNIFCNENDVLFIYSANKIYKSLDNGESWERIYNDTTNNSQLNISLITVHNDDIYAFTRGGFVIISEDAGKSWNDNLTFPLNDEANILCAIVTDSNEIFIGAQDRSMFKSNDKCKTWKSIVQQVGVGNMIYTDQGVLYAASLYYGLYKSIDNGNAWTKVIPSIGTGAFVDDFRYGYRYDSNLYFPLCVHKSGAVFSNDNDGSLIMYRNDSTLKISFFDNAKVHDIDIDNNDNIYVSTDDGIFKSTIDQITDVKNVSAPITSYKLYQNFPNPFNPTTTIKYSIPKREHVSLSIYDVLGSEIAILENNEKEAGEYEISWNASTFPSGVYFCRIKAGSFMDSKKLLLVK